MNSSSDCATLAVRRCHAPASSYAARVKGLPPRTIRFPPRSRYCRIASQSASGQADPYGSTRRFVSFCASALPNADASVNVAPLNAACRPASSGAGESAAGNPACQKTTVFAKLLVETRQTQTIRSKRNVRPIFVPRPNSWITLHPVPACIGLHCDKRELRRCR